MNSIITLKQKYCQVFRIYEGILDINSESYNVSNQSTISFIYFKYKTNIADYEKREKQYYDVIDKYKAQHTSNSGHIEKLERQVEEVRNMEQWRNKTNVSKVTGLYKTAGQILIP